MNKYGVYLNLNVVQVNDSLVELMERDIDAFRNACIFLKKTERYKLDYLFRIVLDVLEIGYYLTLGEPEEYSNKLDSLLMRINNSGEEESLIPGINILANAYAAVNRLDKAILCYMKIIHMEKKRGMSLRSAICHHRIGKLYRIHGNLGAALEYALKASKLIPPLPIGNFENDSFWLYNTCDVSMIYFQLRNQERGFYYYNLINYNMPKNFSTKSLAAFKRLEMRVHFARKNLAGVEEAHQKTVALLMSIKGYPTLVAYTIDYYHFCMQLGADSGKVISVLEATINAFKGKADYKFQTAILDIIIKYYLERGEFEQAAPYIKLFHKEVSDYSRQNKQQNNKMIDAMYEKYFYAESLKKVKSEQKELKEEYREILKKNQDIEELYRRLDTIRAIGKDITDSNSLDRMFIKTYHNVKDIIPMERFVMFAFEDNGKRLHPEYIYSLFKEEKKLPTLDLAKTPTLAKIIENKETLVINDTSQNKKLFQEMKIDIKKYKSAILSPIIFKSKMISLTYAVSTKKNAYQSISKEFIIQISIFLAVALNNIRRNESLTNVINENRKTKKELEQVNEKLSSLSKKDSLTKINNRLSFYEFYREKLKEAVKRNKMVSMYMIDIDHFKAYNDHFGHQQGDEALIAVAQVLTENFTGENDMAARYGGEEFIAFSMDDDSADALRKAEELRKAVIAMGIEHPRSDYGVLTVSIGISTINSPNMDDDSYVGMSDEALYQAKRSGRNQTIQIIKA
ncbi:MAG: GGDEF domain-containing protein [Bacillota bacterium]|nr:GGDEF domain-containing protein [Bacillota bacterium]